MNSIEGRIYGKDYADNHIDYLLSFDIAQTWTVSAGTGSATLDTSNPFEGISSLKIENTNPSVAGITVTNTAQSTVVPYDGDFIFSIMAKKNDAEEDYIVDVNIFKNAVALATETFTIGSETASEDLNDVWVRFQSTQNYSFLDGDIITFSFTLNQESGTVKGTNVVWLDGFMMSDSNRISKVAPNYAKPLSGELYNQFTGWADYADSTYTTGSPFTAVDGVQVALPNDAGTIVDSQKPYDVDEFYDGTVITGRNGDGLNITIEFRCRPTTAASNVRIQTVIDIGGAVGEIYKREFSLGKGSGVEHFYLSSFNAYTLGTWEANGGTVKVTAVNDDIEIYDIRYVLTRTHKAR